MEKIDKILVGLDLTEMDKSVLSYVKFINTKLRPSTIDFVNIHKEIDLPDDVVAQFPDLEQKVNQEYVTKLLDQVQGFNIIGADLKCESFEGDALKGILNKTYKGKYDLVVVGRKFDENASKGEVQKMLVRKSAASVLLVPANPALHTKKILFPTDFSEHAEVALKKAIKIADQYDAEVELLNIVSVPTGYYTTGKSFEEFAEIMLTNAKKAAEKSVALCEEAGIKVTTSFPVQKDEDDSFYIKEASTKSKSDLIIIGAKGRTNLAAVILGSTTEDLINTGVKIPLLIIKEQKTFDIWDALKVI